MRGQDGGQCPRFMCPGWVPPQTAMAHGWRGKEASVPDRADPPPPRFVRLGNPAPSRDADAGGRGAATEALGLEAEDRGEERLDGEPVAEDEELRTTKSRLFRDGSKSQLLRGGGNPSHCGSRTLQLHEVGTHTTVVPAALFSIQSWRGSRTQGFSLGDPALPRIRLLHEAGFSRRHGSRTQESYDGGTPIQILV